MPSIPESDTCRKCGGPMGWKQAHRYPVISQVIFGVSLVAFLILNERLAGNRSVIWAWTVVQIGLGIVLVRGRLRARHRILRCIRCSEPLP